MLAYLMIPSLLAVGSPCSPASSTLSPSSLPHSVPGELHPFTPVFSSTWVLISLMWEWSRAKSLMWLSAPPKPHLPNMPYPWFGKDIASYIYCAHIPSYKFLRGKYFANSA